MSALRNNAGFVFAACAVAAFALVSWLLPRADTEGPAIEMAGHGIEPVVRMDEPDSATRVAATREIEPSSPTRVAEAPESKPSDVAAPESVRPTGEVALAGATLFGRLADEAGEPIGGRVVLHTTEGPFGEVWSGEDGRWSAAPLPAGLIELSVRATGVFPMQHSVELPPGQESLRVDLVVERMREIDVVLRAPDGRPGMEVFREVASTDERYGDLVRRQRLTIVPLAVRELPGPSIEVPISNPNEHYGIGNFWEARRFDRPTDDGFFGRVTIRERGPCWMILVAGGRVLDQVAIEDGVTEVALTLDPNVALAPGPSVRARLVDRATGEPILGGLTVSTDPFFGREYQGDAETGEVVVENTLVGRQYAVFGAEGYAELVRTIDVPLAGELDLGTVEMSAPVTIRGHVRRPDGTPIVAELRWGRLDEASGEVEWVRQRSATSDGDGAFRLSGLQPGRWLVATETHFVITAEPADAYLCSRPLEVEVWEGEVLDAVVTVMEATLVTCHLEGASEPWPRLAAYDRNGILAGRTWIGFHGPDSYLPLLPGTYEVALKKGGVELQRRSITVGTEPLLIDFSD